MDIEDMIERLREIQDEHGNIWVEHSDGSQVYREDLSIFRNEYGDVVSVQITRA